MKIEKLPNFLKKNYEHLQASSQEKDVLEISMKMFEEAVRFMGKLYLLEYVHQKRNDDAINYLIFAKLDTDDIASWITLVKNLRFLWKKNNVLPYFSAIEFFAPLFQDENDILERMLWFYKITHMQTGVFLTSPSDAGECKDAILLLIEYFSFFENISYEVKNKESFLLYNEKCLALKPFYSLKLEGSGGLQLCADESDNIVKIFAREWFPQEFGKHQQEKKGDISFVFSKKQISIMPWVETSIKDALHQVFLMPQDMKTRKITVHGYPATGKTTICKNIQEIVCNDCDFTLQYFITPNSLYQDSTTFKLWFYHELRKIFNIEKKVIEKNSDTIQATPGFFELQEHLMESQLKIVCCIDGIDHMSSKEFSHLHSFVMDDLFNGISFIFFKRLFSNNTINSTYKIEVKPEDNSMYQEVFDAEYTKELTGKYLDTEIKQKIFRHLSNFDKKAFSLKDLSEIFEIHTPTLLKSIEEMKPLLKISKNSYQLFHQIAKNFVDSLPVA